ncbi:uncharacterized protein TM35_000351230 [Trypanosoma theileri]|uniref:Uncharacterized protein n=1 Tax=Trypanosoma theileri TaxID=67003 RepID=A0A1X0NMK5_9TRYP|nr:uncharacterized protein TM35_000351230 [Trypanosoma theileri]ORC85379.1 hypothetical protein TM35_000351230 [Trypanosoma theileri]
MSEYKTPGRQASTLTLNAGNNGSVGRRVVRSALELLADTASPELLKQQAPPSCTSGPRKQKFTVTYATDPPGRVEEIMPGSPLNRTLPPQQEQKWSSLTTGVVGCDDVSSGSVGGGCSVIEEPSTLLFLSPASSTTGGDSAVKKRLFKKRKKAIRLTDSSKKLAATAAAAASREKWHMDESDRDNDEDKKNISGSSSSRRKSPRDNDNLLSRSEPLFTEEEVRHRISLALKAYETQRDAEEESVLQEVGHEIETQNERYEKLLQEKEAIAAERDVLQEKMEQLARECESLQSTIAELHQELQEERDKVGRVEVELCHAQDEKRLATTNMQQELNFERAQWNLAQEEMRRQINEFETQLQIRASEWRELQDSMDFKESERVRLSEQLEISQKEIHQRKQQMDELKSSNAELQELARAKDALIRQLQHKVQETEKIVRQTTASTRDEQTQHESRLRGVEEALKQQTDEVRRNIHRIHMLEADQVKAEKTAKALRRTIRDTLSGFTELQSALETLVETFGTRQRPAPLIQRGLKGALFPPERREVETLLTSRRDFTSSAGGVFIRGESVETDQDCETVMMLEEENEEEDSLLGLVTHKELREDLKKNRFVSKKAESTKQQKQNHIQQKQSSLQQSASRKGTLESGKDEGDDCGRLQRCQRQCERLLETLHQVFLQRQKEYRRHIERLEAQQKDQSNQELIRCREELTACQAKYEESQKQQQQLSQEFRRRSSEVQHLETKLAEMRTVEQGAKAQQKRLLVSVEELQRERGILQLQLEASQQECVELREQCESIRSETGQAQERLRRLEEQQHTREEEHKAKEKALAKLARLTEKLKKTEMDCQSLRDENDLLSTKVKSMLLQLQTARMHRSKVVTQPTQHQQEQREELNRLTKELGALRQLQESAVQVQAKERDKSESSLSKLRAQNEELREKLVQEQRALADIRNEAELERRAEAATLRTLLTIHQGSSEASNEVCTGGGTREEVQQRLFDSTPRSHVRERSNSVVTTDGVGKNNNNNNNNNTGAVYVEMTTAEMRGQAVSLAQRAVLELARLREALAQGSSLESSETKNKKNNTKSSNNNTKLEEFRAVEKLAWEAAQQSAVRRRSSGGDEWDANALPPPPRVTPMLRSAIQPVQKLQRQDQENSVKTPNRRSVSHKSPSPRQLDVDVISAGMLKNAAISTRSLPRNCTISSSLTSMGGVSRSHSGQRVLDGSNSPGRPPMLRAASAR